MSEAGGAVASEQPSPPPDASPHVPRSRHGQRLRFIDATRGLFVLWMTLGEYENTDCSESATCTFFFSHMGTSATSVTAYDLVMVGFLMFMGFLFTRSFARRVASEGTGHALLHACLRSGGLLVMGLLTMRVDDLDPFPYYYDGNDNLKITWDVVPSLGLAGLVALAPMVALLHRPWRRMFVGFALLCVYQLLMCLPQTGWRKFARRSAHGGILATIFVFSGIIVISSSMGDILLSEREQEAQSTSSETEGLVAHGSSTATPAPADMKDWANWIKSFSAKPAPLRLFLIGCAFAVAGVLVAQVPSLYASKREASFAWALTALGLSCGVSGVFWILEAAYDVTVSLLVWWGSNPFFVYIFGGGVALMLQAAAGAFSLELHAGVSVLLLLTGTAICTIAVYALRNRAIDTLHICLCVSVCLMPSFVLTYVRYEWLAKRETLRDIVFLQIPQLIGLAIAVAYSLHGKSAIAALQALFKKRAAPQEAAHHTLA